VFVRLPEAALSEEGVMKARAILWVSGFVTTMLWSVLLYQLLVVAVLVHAIVDVLRLL
jgi:hypothetical protein